MMDLNYRLNKYLKCFTINRALFNITSSPSPKLWRTSQRDVNMKMNSCYLVLFLLVVSGKLVASEWGDDALAYHSGRSDGLSSSMYSANSAMGPYSGNSRTMYGESGASSLSSAPSASSAASSSSAMAHCSEGAWAKVDQLRPGTSAQLQSFIKKCRSTNSIKNPIKGFVALMAICSIFWKTKNPAKAFLMAMKGFLALRSLEWVIVSYNRQMLNGTMQYCNMLFSNGQAPEGARDQLLSLPGNNTQINLNDIELLTNQSFTQLISQEESYFLARVATKFVAHSASFNSLRYHYVDARALQRKLCRTDVRFLLKVVGDPDLILAEATLSVPRPNDASFSPDNKRQERIEDIRYYELKQDSSSEFVGSLVEADTEQLIPRFVNLIADNEIAAELQNFQQSFCHMQALHPVDKHKRAVVYLQAFIVRLKALVAQNRDTYFRALALAQFLLASQYHSNRELDLATGILQGLDFTLLEYQSLNQEGNVAHCINNLRLSLGLDPVI
jgi:hypothetical protein